MNALKDLHIGMCVVYTPHVYTRMVVYGVWQNLWTVHVPYKSQYEWWVHKAHILFVREN